MNPDPEPATDREHRDGPNCIGDLGPLCRCPCAHCSEVCRRGHDIATDEPHRSAYGFYTFDH